MRAVYCKPVKNDTAVYVGGPQVIGLQFNIHPGVDAPNRVLVKQKPTGRLGSTPGGVISRLQKQQQKNAPVGGNSRTHRTYSTHKLFLGDISTTTTPVAALPSPQGGTE